MGFVDGVCVTYKGKSVTTGKAFFMAYLDIVLLALVAGFILLRLRSVLGQRNEGDLPPPPMREDSRDIQPVVQIPDRARMAAPVETEEDAAVVESLSPLSRDAIAAIRGADPQFTTTTFLVGARRAFEMVFDAFVKGDRETLKMLLSPKVFEDFAAELDRRSGMESFPETTLVAVTSQTLTGAEYSKPTARLTVKFASEQVTVIRGQDGKILEGNPSDTDTVEDEWVFEREMNSRNPNWKIVST